MKRILFILLCFPFILNAQQVFVYKTGIGWSWQNALADSATVMAALASKASSTGGAAITTVGTLASGSIPYSLLTGTPTVPTNTNQLTNGAGFITSYTETDPIVKAISGIVKSNGTTISAATAGTDYLTPSGSAASLTNFPTFNQNTTGSAGSVANAITFNNAGSGAASGSTFNGASAVTISYNSIGAASLTGSNWAFTSQAIGDLAYATSTTAYGRLADVATGSVLISGGVGTAPSWSVSPAMTAPTASTTASQGATTAIINATWARTYTQSSYATATVLTPGTTVTFTPVAGTNQYTLVPAQTETINMGTIPATCVGQIIFLEINTSGTTSYTLTFGTNIRYSTSTLATGTTTAKQFLIAYLCESTTSMVELYRTVAQ